MFINKYYTKTSRASSNSMTALSAHENAKKKSGPSKITRKNAALNDHRNLFLKKKVGNFTQYSVKFKVFLVDVSTAPNLNFDDLKDHLKQSRGSLSSFTYQTCWREPIR